jgi:hypothetical protein
MIQISALIRSVSPDLAEHRKPAESAVIPGEKYLLHVKFQYNSGNTFRGQSWWIAGLIIAVHVFSQIWTYRPGERANLGQGIGFAIWPVRRFVFSHS